MIQVLAILVIGLVLIAGAAVAGPKLGIAAPILLVLVGIGAGFLPFVPDINIHPDWILEGLLPPLLYAVAVSMPVTNFRRELGAISGLAVVLVLLSALGCGLFFHLVLNVSFVWGFALGAIISPTDAVACGIIKKSSASQRVVAILEGESLFNDASSLVLLRAATVAAAASFSVWSTIGSFLYSLLVAGIIGGFVGWGNLVIRKRVADPTINTLLSFTVPFLASVPTELLGASGLVAAVVAGVIVGIYAPRQLPPSHRISDSQNWASVATLLEGLIFLTMGLQMAGLLHEVEHAHIGIAPAFGVAMAALGLVLVFRGGFVAAVLAGLKRRMKRFELMQPFVEALREHRTINDPARLERLRQAHIDDKQLLREARRVRRRVADLDYYLKHPMGAREGTLLVWAGMRGAITVAAAQTLPLSTPSRTLLLFIAFAIATVSLLLQGATIGPLVGWLFKSTPESEAAARTEAAAEQTKLAKIMATVAEHTERNPADGDRQYRIAVLDRQREALLNARSVGAFDSDILQAALENLDAEQFALTMQEDADHSVGD